jgi:alginate O-acetyltransferase complex protein AlgI
VRLIQSWIFWAVTLGSCLVFWQLPVRMRATFLACVCAGYLLTLDPFSVFALLVLTTVFYACAPYLPESRPRHQRVLAALVLLACLFLAAFKYAPALLQILNIPSPIAAIAIPLGISYYCFKLVHFAIEASRGTLDRGRLDTFFLYMFWFPIFTAGPIERYGHFVENRGQGLDRNDLIEGSHRVIVGVIKQAVLVELIRRAIYPSVPTVTALLARLEELPTHIVWLLMLRTYLQVYISFSAYSDVAIGISRLFGLRILENFHWPIVASSASDYWQRWHMTLSRWCQDYIYLPALGHTRNPYVALQISFFVMGMWHEATATRLLWGAYHACAVGVFTAWSRTRRRRKWNRMDGRAGVALAIAITQAYVIGGWAILAGEDSGDAYQGIRVLAKLVFVELRQN